MKTGKIIYIYHGNDGTNMPWNDTAQLNFLKEEVREQVVETILAVASLFPIIRFDAAMTLAKQHIQRLWFPETVAGDAIPSRAEQGMTKEAFDKIMPQEFWREVVDRVASEAPGTLLLAEAFWMLESYFVRDLGMHRVYNSAFMHMLRDEENGKYREFIKNTINLDGGIFKRFVNYMNNPDENTAVEQYGKQDKYFGICVLMSTMPGTPMFGHGQIEGFSEKYGMEYLKAMQDEKVDQDFIRQHEEKIFPLLRNRKLYAGVENFRLYDFHRIDGKINENVFVYSNQLEDELVLVLYNNKYAQGSGRVNKSAPINPTHEKNKFLASNIATVLNLPDKAKSFVLFRNSLTGLFYLRNCKIIHEEGMEFFLQAYESLVLVEFEIVEDSKEKKYTKIAARLGNSGFESIEKAQKEIDK